MISQLKSIKRILVTGGAGFIGGNLIRRLLLDTDAQIFNLDKMGYASDLTGIDKTLKQIKADLPIRHTLIKADLYNYDQTQEALKISNPDFVIHLAAESHVDRSIDDPSSFLQSNIIGTYNLLKAVHAHWSNLSTSRKKLFRFHHISTDEVYGSLGANGQFTEKTPYSPRSPYSASKAASDHLVNAWFHTYGLPVILTNCTNNYGPWQFPEKLIPLSILNAISGKQISLYGDGLNIRDWLYVDDHIDALLLVAFKGTIGSSYCIGGAEEKTNKDVINEICYQIDHYLPSNRPHSKLIKYVYDRPGHDRRYAINFNKIQNELGWKPKHSFKEGIKLTVQWYIKNQDWCHKRLRQSTYKGQRLGSKNDYG